MPFDLPPTLPPQLANVAALEQQYDSADHDDQLILNVGGYRLLISGNTYLTTKRIRAVVAAARTPSQAIRLLNALYRADGHLFVNVTYAPDPGTKDIYVHVYEGMLAEVKAPPEIAPFFTEFVNEPGVTTTDVASERILAGAKAERAGYNMFSRFALVEGKPKAFQLIIDGREDADYKPYQFVATFGNPGNRFLGRYFGFANLTTYTPTGDQVTFGYGTAFTGIGDARNGDEYNHYSLGYSAVTTYGLYSLNGSYTKYEAEELLGFNDREQAEILQASITGNQFLYADKNTRLVLLERIQYVDSTLEITQGSLTVQTGSSNPLGGLLGGLLGDLLGPILGGGVSGGQTQTINFAGLTIQDEHYAAIRLGLSYSQSWRLFAHPGKLTLTGGYEQGFAGDIDNTLVDNQRTADFGIADASLAVSYRLPANLLASLTLKGQYSTDDRTPQQKQWVLGGPNNLAAYLPGVLLGDTGAYARFKIGLPRWHLFTRPIRLSLFAEIGSASFEGDNPPAGRTERETISDAGIKLEFSPFEHFVITGYAAETLSTNNIPDARLEAAEADFYFTAKVTF